MVTLEQALQDVLERHADNVAVLEPRTTYRDLLQKVAAQRGQDPEGESVTRVTCDLGVDWMVQVLAGLLDGKTIAAVPKSMPAARCAALDAALRLRSLVRRQAVPLTTAATAASAEPGTEAETGAEAEAEAEAETSQHQQRASQDAAVGWTVRPGQDVLTSGPTAAPVRPTDTAEKQHPAKEFFLDQNGFSLTHTAALHAVSLVSNAQHSADTGEDNPAFVFMTSGTTGEPKAVFVPRHALLRNILAIGRAWDLNVTDVVLVSSPPTFDVVLTQTLGPLLFGGAIAFLPEDKRRSPGRVLLEHASMMRKITVLSCTPSWMMSIGLAVAPMLFASPALRVVAMGGEPFPPAQVMSRAVLNCRSGQPLRLFNMYGLTEFSVWLTAVEIGDNTSLPLESVTQYAALAGAVGGAPIAQLAPTGCQVVNVLDGVADRVEVWDNTLFVNGVSTHDTVVVDDARRVWYIGRDDRIFKPRGVRVSARELENIVMDELGAFGRMFRVQAIMRDGNVEVIIIAPVVRPGDLDRRRLLERFRAAVPEQAVPTRVLVVPPLNARVTETGKMDFHALTEQDAVWVMDMTVEESTIRAETLLPPSRLASNAAMMTPANLLSLWLSLCGWRQLRQREPVDPSRHLISYAGDSMTATRAGTLLHRGFPHIPAATLAMDLLHLPIGRVVERIRQHPVHHDAPVSAMNWRIPVGACVDAPITLGMMTHCFATSHAGHVVAFEPLSGRQQWATQLSGRVTGAPLPVFARQIVVVCAEASGVTALRLSDGTASWTVNLAQVSTGAVMQPGNQLVVAQRTGSLCYLNLAANGAVIAQIKLPGPCTSGLASSLSDACVYGGTLTGHVWRVDTQSYAMTWQHRVGGPVFTTPVRAGDAVIALAVSGTAHAYRHTDGAPMWTIDVPGPLYCTPLQVTSNVIVFGSHACKLYCLTASGRLTKMRDTQAPVFATPALTMCGCLVFADIEGRVFIGSKLLTQLPAAVFCSPAVIGPHLFAGCRDDFMYCLNLHHACDRVPRSLPSFPNTPSPPSAVSASGSSSTGHGVVSSQQQPPGRKRPRPPLAASLAGTIDVDAEIVDLMTDAATSQPTDMPRQRQRRAS